MGRRVKEAPQAHRERISKAAQELFSSKGIEAATVSEIADRAGYSKATLYVYFKNKEEIVGYLAYKSMEMLRGCIQAAIAENRAVKEQYLGICWELARFQQDYPFYFEIVLDEINIDFEKPDALEIEKDTFRVGEEINALMARFIRGGIARGALRGDLDIPQTVFAFWASLSGIVRMAAKKAAYIEKAMGQDQKAFLSAGFQLLYRSIEGDARDA